MQSDGDAIVEADNRSIRDWSEVARHPRGLPSSPLLLSMLSSASH